MARVGLLLLLFCYAFAPTTCLGAPASRSVPTSPELAILLRSREIALFSLEPDLAKPSAAKFHGYPILGSTMLSDPERRIILERFVAGIDVHPTIAAACFLPRHGLRVKSHGHTLDFLICFQCIQVEIYRDNERVSWWGTNNAAQQVFNEVLARHHVKLPPRQ